MQNKMSLQNEVTVAYCYFGYCLVINLLVVAQQIADEAKLGQP